MSNKIYSWNIDFYHVDANEVGKELETIEQTSELNAEEVVNYAKDNVSSTLNQLFEWDDTIAGHKYRLEQARHIISNIRVEIVNKKEEKKTIRAFVKTTKSHQENFSNIQSVISDVDKYSLLLNKAYKELTATKYRYQDLEEIQEILKDVPEIF